MPAPSPGSSNSSRSNSCIFGTSDLDIDSLEGDDSFNLDIAVSLEGSGVFCLIRLGQAMMLQGLVNQLVLWDSQYSHHIFMFQFFGPLSLAESHFGSVISEYSLYFLDSSCWRPRFPPPPPPSL